MGFTVLKDLLISLGRAEDYIEGPLPVSLWRAHDTGRFAHPMDFYEENTVLSNGRPREADITITPDEKGVLWVRVHKLPAGASTFDRSGAFPGKRWRYFKIPKGTRLPDGLALIKGHYSKTYQATHYTIAPVREMTLTEFKHLLLKLFAGMMRDAI